MTWYPVFSPRVRRPPMVTLLALATLGGGACREQPPDTLVRASGFAEATEIRVASEVGGRIVTLAVDEGARVQAGDPIATIDTEATDLALARLRAEREHALAQLRLLEAPPRLEDVRLAEAQVAVARAEVASMQAELDAAKADFQRFEDLLEARAGSRKARDDARTRVSVTIERLRAADERVAAATAALDGLRAGARRQELDVARARVATADAQLATLDKSRRDATVVAPAAGLVTETLVEVGELVSPRAPLVVLVDLDHAWATVYVGEPIVPRIAIGSPAAVSTDAPGQTLEGRVSYISPRAEFTPRNVQTAEERAKLVYRVRIAVDNRGGVLKPGMPVEAAFDLARPEAGS